jgi:glycosyltransferase involved in cell wall biosynthesis
VDGLWLYRHPVWAPSTDRPGLKQLTRRLRWLALRQAMARIGMHDPIITWVFQPKNAELAGALGECLLVFHVVDEYAAFRHRSPEEQHLIREGERLYLPRADLVIVTSRALLESKRQFNPHTVLVPNGVDFSVFEKVRRANLPPPEDIARLTRPVIGYSGHISLRLNLPLLAEVARQRPEWSLVMVGSVWETGCKEELATLRKLPNVHFLGTKSPEQVPHYIFAFDVCLIPYRQGEEARNISPIKLYEYLAAGKPIVTIDIPALNGFRHVVRVAESAEKFIAEIEVAMSENDSNLVEERRLLASANTWDQRVEEISTLVRGRLDAKINSK